ncbi:hypothetical protein B9Z55_025174 [Caenorhabditis nigoni]|uniref:Uncharacterized protein n=1 Tax=Caenorhabditis nigoni TaxID=1611254 RepID=A0A2G5SXT2_9PELO|nr:hypothetical protein B9Z55_025174 [Caenorhabditis nigoni]
MSVSKSSIRRIGFLLGAERFDNNDTAISDQDDLSCSVTIVCNFLITFLAPIYYCLFFKQRKEGIYKKGQRIMNQIMFVSIPTSLFCICNTIYFITECI